MSKQINFRGQSGRSYDFQQMDVNGAWARMSGIAVFAAPHAFGLRIIRIAELTGRNHDVSALVALSHAERYGASRVYIHEITDTERRRQRIEDLETGLSPVCGTTRAARAPFQPQFEPALAA